MKTLSTSSPSLRDAIAELLTAKLRSGRRKKTVDNLRQFLSRYAKGREESPIAPVCRKHLVSWIDEAESAWGRQTRMAILSTLYSFATRRGWLTENPISRLERIHIDHTPPKILTVAQCRALLGECGPAIRPWVSACLFAGLRPSEAERLDWSAVRLSGADPCIVVDASASKVRRRRIVPLHPTAGAWLALDARTSGPIVSSHSTLRRARREAVKASGVPWSPDVLRHTHASMRIGAGDPPDRVASDLGNSVRILLTHYRELVLREDAEEFWNLRPKIQA